jgi:hypothetical protein
MRDPRVGSRHLSRDAYLYIRQSTLRHSTIRVERALPGSVPPCHRSSSARSAYISSR